MSHSENFETLDHPEEINTASVRLPVFLKTLAILTFVGCFLRIITAIAYISVMSSLMEISKSLSSLSPQNTDPDILNGYRWSIIFSYISIANAVFCTLAAILMLNRKITGYWIYMSVQVILIFAIVTVALFSPEENNDGIMQLFNVGMIVIIAGFCIMYTLNKKHLGKPKALKNIEI